MYATEWARISDLTLSSPQTALVWSKTMNGRVHCSYLVLKHLWLNMYHPCSLIHGSRCLSTPRFTQELCMPRLLVTVIKNSWLSEGTLYLEMAQQESLLVLGTNVTRIMPIHCLSSSEKLHFYWIGWHFVIYEVLMFALICWSLMV